MKQKCSLHRDDGARQFFCSWGGEQWTSPEFFFRKTDVTTKQLSSALFRYADVFLLVSTET